MDVPDTPPEDLGDPASTLGDIAENARRDAEEGKTPLAEIADYPFEPTIDSDTIFLRAVGEGGTAQIKLCGAEQGWLDKPGNREKGEDAARQAYEAAFDEQPTRIGVAALPWSNREDGDGEDD